MIGFWQIALIVYVLFLAIGPRRVVRWVRVANRTIDGVRGRPTQPRKSWDFLRTIEMFEHSTAVGWACVGLALGLLVLDGVCRNGYCGFYGPPVLALAMLLFFIAPWLI